MLRGRNKTYGTIKFVDISSDSYSPEENSDIDFEEVSPKSRIYFYKLIYHRLD